MDKQADFVLRTIEERDIRFVRLWFTDVLGTLKSVAVAPPNSRVPSTKDGLRWLGDRRFRSGVSRTCSPNPIPSTFAICPGGSESPGVARLFCDIRCPMALRRTRIRGRC